ncbi:hypothetical protein K1719_005626 [Acacia pycnantha]|nr:hypothetical protein K1719_005626 [Acacia pycnantha]
MENANASSSSRLEGILEEEYDLIHGYESSWVEARTSCYHLGSLAADHTHIPTPETPCKSCQHPSGNWMCLSCKDVLCGRYVNRHMLRHHQRTSHSVALSLSDLSVWCYSCESFLDAQVIPRLRAVHEMASMLKLREALPLRTVNNPLCSSNRTSCYHLGGSLEADLTQIPTPETPCNSCQHPSGNWMCLSCKDVLCGRYVNRHMLRHHQRTSHSVALSLSDLSVWCYSCESFLDAQVIPRLRAVHEMASMLKLREAPPLRTVNNPLCSSNRTSCYHLGGSLEADLTQIPTPETPCNSCQHPSGNWMCLSCKDVLCGRYVNRHMLRHHQRTSHSVALSLSDLSVWCYYCESYLDAQVIPRLRAVHEMASMLKLREAPPLRIVNNPLCSSNRTSCYHLGSLEADLTQIPTPETPCNSCQHPSGNWMCLSCKDVLCGRYVNRHMLRQHQQTSHSVSLSLSDLSV